MRAHPPGGTDPSPQSGPRSVQAADRCLGLRTVASQSACPSHPAACPSHPAACPFAHHAHHAACPPAPASPASGRPERFLHLAVEPVPRSCPQLHIQLPKATQCVLIQHTVFADRGPRHARRHAHPRVSRARGPEPGLSPQGRGPAPASGSSHTPAGEPGRWDPDGAAGHRGDSGRRRRPLAAREPAAAGSGRDQPNFQSSRDGCRPSWTLLRAMFVGGIERRLR